VASRKVPGPLRKIKNSSNISKSMAMEAGEPSLNLLVYICLSIFLYGAQLHLYLSLALTSSIFLQVLTDVEKVAG
jgi:hypothetical protein